MVSVLTRSRITIRKSRLRVQRRHRPWSLVETCVRTILREGRTSVRRAILPQTTLSRTLLPRAIAEKVGGLVPTAIVEADAKLVHANVPWVAVEIF